MYDHLKKLSIDIGASLKNKNLNQSILLSGKDGVGKFSLVRDIARFILCENDMSGCGKCQPCGEVAEFNHPDFLLLFPFPKIKPEQKKVNVFSFSDPNSSRARYSIETLEEIERFKAIKTNDPFALVDFEKKENIPVEVVKDLIWSLSKKPLRGGRRVVGILDIDKMAYGAADLFLKTVEEPPHNTHIVMTTSRPDTLYPTLLSRASIIKIPPSPIDEIENYIKEKTGLDENEASFVARISGGSPGRAVYFAENDIVARRNMLFDFIFRLSNGNNINALIEDVNTEYSRAKIGTKLLQIDFEIMETILHDIYLSGENNLENRMLNIDIRQKFERINRPATESLDIWQKCCVEVKRACLVNNVNVSTAMSFFYIACADAIINPAGVNFKLP